MTLHYGNFGIFLMMGNAGFISSTVDLSISVLLSQDFPAFDGIDLPADSGSPSFPRLVEVQGLGFTV